MKRGSASRSCGLHEYLVSKHQGCATYFANVDESTHQVLVAEGLNGALRLIRSCVFHDPGCRQSLYKR